MNVPIFKMIFSVALMSLVFSGASAVTMGTGDAQPKSQTVPQNPKSANSRTDTVSQNKSYDNVREFRKKCPVESGVMSTDCRKKIAEWKKEFQSEAKNVKAIYLQHISKAPKSKAISDKLIQKIDARFAKGTLASRVTDMEKFLDKIDQAKTKLAASKLQKAKKEKISESLEGLRVYVEMKEKMALTSLIK